MFRHLVLSLLTAAVVLWCLPLPVSAATLRESDVATLCHAMGNLVALTTTWRDTGMSRAWALQQLRAHAKDAGERALAEVFVDMPYSNPQVSGTQILHTFHTACPGLIRQRLANK